MTRFAAALLLCALPMSAPAEPAATLPPAVAYVAGALGIPPESVSIWVQDVLEPTPLLEINVDTPRNPASTMKLVTTFAALEVLGPAYTWPTEVYVARRPDASRVNGDVWIRSHGDPYFVTEEAYKLVAELVRRGIGTVEGDLVFDDGFFELAPDNRAAFDHQPDRVYNALPSPLLANFNAVRFIAQTGGHGRVNVIVDPPLPNLTVDNRLRVSTGPCIGFQRGIALSIGNAALRNVAVLEGAFPSGCREYELARTVLQPDSYAFGLFKLLWQQLDGEVKGGFRRGPPPPEAGEPFYVHQSKSLGDVVRLVNKFSNNVMTLNFELTLGAEQFGAPGTRDKGRRAILELLANRGVDTNGLVIDNAAGLSRDGRISAKQLGAVLAAAWKSPYMPEFVSSLSLTGLDGTLRDRFVGMAEQGRMHLKTGRLDDVSAVAGYVTAASGRRLMVVMLLNAPGAHRGLGTEMQNALLRWAFRL